MKIDGNCVFYSSVRPNDNILHIICFAERFELFIHANRNAVRK